MASGGDEPVSTVAAPRLVRGVGWVTVDGGAGRDGVGSDAESRLAGDAGA